jgi:hypothetical protein
VSLFTRLFKSGETQEGEQPSAEGDGSAQTPAAERGPAAASVPEARAAASAPESAPSAKRGREATRPPAVPKRAPTAAVDPDVTITMEPDVTITMEPDVTVTAEPDITFFIESDVAPPPARASTQPQDAKAMFDKPKKPADSSPVAPENSQARGAAGNEKPEVSAGKPGGRAIPAPSGTRAPLPEPKPAPRTASASLLKAAQAAADKRAAPRPNAEAPSAKAPAGASAPVQRAGEAAAPPVQRAGEAAAPPVRAGEAAAPPAAAAAVAQPAPSSTGSAPAAATAASLEEALSRASQAAPAKPLELEPSPHELFDASAPQLLDGLLHLMLELRGSAAAPGDWARSSAASLRMLRAMGERLGNKALLEALDSVLSLLERVERDALARIDGELRDELVRAYASLRAHIPAAADPEYELGRRDPPLVEQILLQVNGVQLTTLRKLHAAGWTASESFLRRTTDELVRDTGIDAALAERIIGAFRAFRGQFATLVPAPSRAEELRRLAALLDELRGQQARFEQAAARFRDEDLRERRELRAARARSVRGIYALLARLGELERIAALERAPFPAKIAELTTYLSSATRSPTLVS